MKKLLIVAAAMVAASCGAATAQNANHGDRQAWLASADTNHDGKISRTEFIAARGARFAEMDANHDGLLQASERPHWGDHAAENGGAAAQNASAPAHGDHGDANGDGVISRAEYDAQSAQQFDRLDTDRDGFLSPAEIQAMHDRRHQNS